MHTVVYGRTYTIVYKHNKSQRETIPFMPCTVYGYGNNVYSAVLWTTNRQQQGAGLMCTLTFPHAIESSDRPPRQNSQKQLIANIIPDEKFIVVFFSLVPKD
jgi:hypothetical protein